MNEQLQEALATLLTKTLQGIDASAAFLQVELPDVIQQILVWYAVSSGIDMVLGLLLILGWVFAERSCLKYIWNNYEEGESRKEALCYDYTIVGSIIRILPAYITINLVNLEWLQIIVAPKLWLIEYAARLAS